MSAEKKKQMGVLGLIVALVVVLIGGVLFVGAASGWFDDPKVVLDAEYKGDFDGYWELSAEEYDELVAAQKSFVVFVDQDGCTTADKLRGYVEGWARDNGVKVYRMMFSDMKKSGLHEVVKYYPSFAVVSRGKPTAWLRADADEDAEAYNSDEAFRVWISKYL